MTMRRYLFILFSISFLISDAQDAHLMLPIGHTDEVICTEYSQDGKWLLSSGKDGNIKVWETSTGREVLNIPDMRAAVHVAKFSPESRKIAATNGLALSMFFLDGKKPIMFAKHGGRINHFAFSPDGNLIASACQDKIIRIFNANTGELIRQLDDHLEGVHYVEFSPDSKTLVSASWDRTAILFEVASGKILQIFQDHEGNLNTVHFNRDGLKVITSSWDKKTRVFSINNGKQATVLEGQKRTILDANWSPDGKMLFIASMDSTLRIMDASDYSPLFVVRHEAPISDVKITQDSRYCISADKSGTVAIYDLGSHALVKQFKAHSLGVNALAVNAKEGVFTTASSDYTLHQYGLNDIVLRNDLRGHTEKVDDFIFSPDGKWMASIHQDSMLRVLDISTGKLVSTCVPGGYLRVLSFARDGKRIAAGGNSGMLYLIDPVTGKLEQAWTAMHGEIRLLAWGPEGDRIYLGGDEAIMRCVEVASGNEIHQYSANRGAVIDMRISRSGNYLLSGGYDSSVTVFDTKTGLSVYRLEGLPGKVQHVRFSDNELYFLAVAKTDIYVHETITGKRKFILQGHDWFIHDVAFSPNSKYVLSAGADNRANLFELEFGRLKYKLSGNGYPIYSLDFNQAGDAFILAGGDQLVHIYQTESGKELHQLQGHFAPLRKAAFTPEGKHAVSIGRGHQTVIWDVNLSTQLYSRMQLDDDNWLLYDAEFHFDGSRKAREELFVVCGLETIALEQIKDALYVPDLATMRFRGDSISFPGLKELDLCGKLPQIQPKTNSGGFSYEIVPRKSNIEFVEVYVNNRLTKTVPKDSLEVRDGNFYFDVPDQQISPMFIGNETNKIEVVAVTSSGDKKIRSRGTVEIVDEVETPSETPRLFAVMIGVNEYADPNMKLTYPVNDAIEMGQVVQLTAGEFLGQNNVVVYKLNSEAGKSNPSSKPTKDNIKRVIAEIGSQARPQDVFLLFFAGHGEMKGLVDQKYTLLTAEATKQQFIGISTPELRDWLSPEGPFNMKANKVVLIFDACNSGQANKEFQTKTTYTESNSRRKRQLEDLKDKSGLVILSASAPDRPAYENPQLQHGLLTYCMLKSLKTNTEILEDRGYLNITRWFDATENELEIVSQRFGQEQDAQPFGTTNLCIGFVTDSIRSLIDLPMQRPMVRCSDAGNRETFGDNLGLKVLLNDYLQEQAEKADNPFDYAKGAVPGSYEVKLSYYTKKGKIYCMVIILKDQSPYQKEEIVVKESEKERMLTLIGNTLIKYMK